MQTQISQDIQTGDVLTRVDMTDVSAASGIMRPADIFQLIRGPKGKTVTITMLRPDSEYSY